LTQSLARHGYPVVATGTTTWIELRCRWRSEDVVVWDVDTERARGRCVQPAVPVLDAVLEVRSKPYAQSAAGTLAVASFAGRARLDAEPAHRGCLVEQEPQRVLLGRAVRGMVERLPQGSRQAGLLIAPAVDADPDVAVGRAGPPPKPQDPVRKSIYPVDIGEKPVPPEADSVALSPGRTDAARQADGVVPGMRVRPGDDPALVERKPRRFWTDLALAFDVAGGGCTNYCDELFTAGFGGALHLLIHLHDLVALDAGMSWNRLGIEERRPDSGSTSAELVGVDVGGRFYLRPPGGVRPYAGLGLSQLAGGGADSATDRDRGAHFLGLGLRMRAGVTWPIWGPLSAGVFVRYALVPWDRQCGRIDAFAFEGSDCTSVVESDPISGSDVWTAGGELGVRFE